MSLALNDSESSLDTLSPQSLVHPPRLPARNQVIVRAVKQEGWGTILAPHDLRERACGDDFRVSRWGQGAPVRGGGRRYCGGGGVGGLGFAGEAVEEDWEGLGVPIHVEEEVVNARRI